MVEFNKLEITSDGSQLLIDVSVKDATYYNDVYLDSIYVESLSTYSKDNRPSDVAFKKGVSSINIGGKEYIPIQIPNDSSITNTITYKLPFYIEDINNYAIEFGIISNPNRDVVLIDANNKQFNLGTFYNVFYTSYTFILAYDSISNKVDIVQKWHYREEDLVFGDKKQYTLSLSVKDILFLLDGETTSDNTPLFVVYVKTKGTPHPDTPCGEDQEYTMGIAINKCPILNYILETAEQIKSHCTIPKLYIDNLLKYQAFILAVKAGNFNKAVEYWKQFYNKGNFKINYNKCNCHEV